MKESSTYAMPMALIVAAIIIGAAILFRPAATPPAATAPTGGAQPAPAADNIVNIKDVSVAGDPFEGDENAPVTIAYWSDYQCPFCQQFDQRTLGSLKTEYLDTHKVKIVFKDFQFLGPDSTTAALAGRAVWDAYPALYYEWRKVIYDNQGSENGGWANRTNILALTSKVPGIDSTKISALMDQKKSVYQAEIDKNKSEGGSFGISGTPGFIIGTQKLSGAIALDKLKPIINSKLK